MGVEMWGWGMKLWAAMMVVVWTCGSAFAGETTCSPHSQPQDDFIACAMRETEQKSADPINRTCAAQFADQTQRRKCISDGYAQRTAAERAAGTKMGDWLQIKKTDGKGSQVVIETTATAIQDATIRLNLECSERAGFQMTIRGTSSLGTPPRTTAYILIDGRPPIEMSAIQLVPEIDFPALLMRHSEPIEREILKSKDIQIRYDTRYGGSSSYSFKFANLKAGEKNVMSVCPAP